MKTRRNISVNMIAIIAILALLVGGIHMAYLNEVSGKVKTKALYIGDGVDKIHSPLQVAPQMATDMLNLSSDLYPSLKVRNGRTELFKYTFGGYSVLTFNYIATSKPFVDSRGDTHFGILYTKPSDSPTVVYLKWVVYYPKINDIWAYYDVLLGTYDSVRQSENADYFANCNFCEFNGMVYLFHVANDGVTTRSHYTRYDVNTYFPSHDYISDGAVTSISPSAIYMDKAFFAENNSLRFSKSQDPTNWTAALDSGTIPLKQGGRITALMPMRDRLFIATENCLFVLFGSRVDSFSVSILADNIGVQSPKCVTQKNGTVYFSSTDGNAYEYNGSTLYNITREPTQTGSNSGVKGGFKEAEFYATSISVENDKLRCIDDRRIVNTTYKKSYVFDLVKRRWYIEDYYLDRDNYLYTWNTGYNSVTDCYNLYTETYFLESHQYIDVYFTKADNGTVNNSIVEYNTLGTAQVEGLTVMGTVTLAGTAKVSYSYKHNANYAGIIYTPVALNDTASMVAEKVRSSLSGAFYGKEEYIVGGTGAVITLTSKSARADDITLVFSVQNQTCTGLAYVISTNVAPGVAPTFKTTSTQMHDDFKWVSPAYQIDTIGKQILKAVHFTYNAPIGTETGVYISKTVDEDDFERVALLPTSSLKRNQKFVLPISRYGLSDWARIKIEGKGNVEIYNMSMEWRIVEKIQ